MIRRQQTLGFFIGLALLISLPSFTVSQTLEDNVSRQEYWCSLAKISIGYEGQDRFSQVENNERKPTIITVPLTDKEAVTYESFSDDGRFYSYMRLYPDRDDKSVLHGVFDLQLEQLSTSSSYLVLGNDGVLRPVSRSNAWSCTIKE